jgi:ABC-type branched-subunit amino acid transport system substrate-binding protein
MNGLTYLAGAQDASTVAIISFPGEYGQDSATGAKMAAEQLGLEVVFDGEGQASIDPADPQTALITGLVQAQPDWVFATMSPSTAAVVMGGTVQDLQAQWTGAVPTYDFRLLDSPLAEFISAVYWQPGYQVPWGTDVPGMDEVREAMLAARPDLRPSDAFITGWQEATIMEAVLRQAAENGDMTRAGIKAAALSLEGIDFQGLAPPQSYAGEPNDYVTREIAMFKPDKALYDEAGGAEQTLSSAPNGGTTGSQLVEDFFVSDVAAGFEFTAPCFVGG